MTGYAFGEPPSGTFLPVAGGTSTGEQVAPSFKASGKTGATATPQILGGGTASGAPSTGAHLKGEFVTDDTGASFYCTVAGTPGTWVQTNSSSYVQLNEYGFALPTGAKAQNFNRALVRDNLTFIITGRLALVAIGLRAGQVVSSITFLSSGTPLAVGSNQWFALYSSARALLGVTSDDTSTAWAANTAKTLSLAVAYTVPTTGLYYVGVTVVASTCPTFGGMTLANAYSGVTPLLVGASTTGLTDPASAPNPAAALTGQSVFPYVAVS